MTKNTKENRAQTRIYFSPDEQVEALLSRSESETQSILVPVLNISQGGLCFTFDKSNIFYKNDHFVLKKLEDKLGPLFNGTVEMIVCWTIQHKDLASQTVGCAFLTNPLPLQNCLSSLIHQKLSVNQNTAPTP